MALSNTQPNGIKQVLRGVINMATGVGSSTVAINVDPQKSELRYLGLKTGDATQVFAIELTNATTLTGYRGGGTAGGCTLMYELTERW